MVGGNKGGLKARELLLGEKEVLRVGRLELLECLVVVHGKDNTPDLTGSRGYFLEDSEEFLSRRGLVFLFLLLSVLI